MKKIFIILITFNILFLIGCNFNNNKNNLNKNNKKITIITTLFPQYDFTKHIVGDKGNVVLILPAGIDSHSFDPTTQDIKSIYTSDLFIYTSDEMEPWVKKILNSSNNNIDYINLSKNIKLLHEHEELKKHKKNLHPYDPHIWLDPNNAIIMVNNILNKLIEIDPDNKNYYNINAKKYINELKKLNEDIEKTIKESNKNTLVFGGKFSYRYFFERYNLNYISVYSTCSNKEEPSIKKISSVIQYIKNNNIKYIYHEEFVDPIVAKSIAEKTGAKLLQFSTAHNVSKEDLNNKTYIDIMKENLENIKKGLEY